MSDLMDGDSSCGGPRDGSGAARLEGQIDAPPRHLTGEGPGAHAFLFAQTIDARCRQRDGLREELTLGQIEVGTLCAT